MDCVLLSDIGKDASQIQQGFSADGRTLLGASSSSGNFVLEINQLQQPYCSVFAGDHVYPGNILIASRIDPLFVAYDLFDKARAKTDGSDGRFCDIDQIFDQDRGTLGSLTAFRSCLASSAPLICDVKEVGDNKYYRLNDDKYFAWLVAKCRQIATALQSGGGEGIQNLDEQQRTLYAIGLVSEYVTDSNHKALLKFFDLEEAAKEGEALRTVDPVAFGSGGGGSNKKMKMDPKEIARERAREKAREKKEEELKKLTKGTKSIMSFFGKKA